MTRSQVTAGPLTVETREPFGPGGIVVRTWRCDGAIDGAEFRAVGRPDRSAIIHGSTKNPGMWQASFFDANGATSDVQASSLAYALRLVNPGCWKLVAIAGGARLKPAEVG